MQQRDKLQNQIVDDSGHNFDEAVINIINDLAHEPETDEWIRENTEQIESFFELPEDL